MVVFIPHQWDSFQSTAPWWMSNMSGGFMHPCSFNLSTWLYYMIYIYISSIIYTIYNKYLIHTHTYGGVYTIYLYIAMAEAVFFASPLRNSRTGWTNSWKAGRANWNPWSWKCLGPRKRQCFSSSPGHPDSFVKVLFCVKNLKSRLHTHFKSFHREFYTLYICIHWNFISKQIEVTELRIFQVGASGIAMWRTSRRSHEGLGGWRKNVRPSSGLFFRKT